MKPFAAATRRLHHDERGLGLPELLVGAAITALVMTGITSAIFTTNGLHRRADDRNRIANGFSVVSLALDRDGAMATATAPARSQTSSASCTTAVDLGFQESGAAVRFQAATSGTDGPYWFQRLSGAGTRTLARNVSSCTWQASQEWNGRWAIRVTLAITGPTGETASHTLRAAPRLW